MSADLAAIRARHAAAVAWFAVSDSQPEEQQAHADRGTLLAEVDALLRERDALTLVSRRHMDAAAALSRLVAITPDEIAHAIAETRGQSPSGVETLWYGLSWTETSPANQGTYRAMAAAVVALLRARLEGSP